MNCSLFWDMTLCYWPPDVVRPCSGLLFMGINLQALLDLIRRRRIATGQEPKLKACYLYSGFPICVNRLFPVDNKDCWSRN
jgi:hypothetical protein